MGWKELWKILSQSETLLDEARSEALEMLDLAAEMYCLVLRATVQEIQQDRLDEIARMDKEVNEMQRDVRRKVFEHLAISRGRDLLSGLVLTSIVIDIERIGDYTKNMREVVTFIPRRIALGEFEEVFESVANRTMDLFQKTRAAFEATDPAAAKENVEIYQEISHEVDGTLKAIMAGDSAGDTVSKRTLGLAFSLRYMKRVAAHLKNICTAISNPYPEIGFRPD